MYDSIGGIGDVQNTYTLRGLYEVLQKSDALDKSGNVSEREKVKDEFLLLFYKELLKQSFNPFEDEEGSFTKAFGQDVLVEKLAQELIKNKAIDLKGLFPNVEGIGGK